VPPLPTPRTGRRARRAVLLSAAVLLTVVPSAMAGGTITNAPQFSFTGTAGEENVVQASYTSANGGSIVITDAGGAAFTQPGVGACVLSNGNRTATCPNPTATSVTINGGDMTDTVSFGAWNAFSQGTTVNGDAGDDVLDGSTLGETLNGGTGNDGISGNAGTDTLNGGVGADNLSGGAGTDTITYSGRTEDLTITLDGVANDGALCPGPVCEGDRAGGVTNDVENVTGGTGSDSITGNTAANVLRGGSGSGNDTVDGGPEGDPLVADTLDGATPSGSGGIDTASYASRTGPITATLDGTDNDGATGTTENDILLNVVNLTGGTGNDVLTGESPDSINGIDGNNVISGGPGDDTLNGGSEDDLALYGTDVLVGGTGVDTATFADRTAADAAATRLNISLDGTANDGVSGETDNVGPDGDVENVIGGTANDVLTGNTLNNALSGGPGNDTLTPGTGADVATGDGGSDTASYAGRATGVTVTLGGGSDDGNSEDGAAGARDDLETESVTGGDGADTLTGDAGNNGLNGGSGNDLLDGQGGADSLAGGNDVDTANYSARTGAVVITIDSVGNDGEGCPATCENDNVTLTTENVVTGIGEDNVSGSPSANVISTGAGADLVDGKAGDDTIDPGTGNDTVDGNVKGAAGDTIAYAGRSAAVTVDLAAGTATIGAETDGISSIENATGGSGNDTLTGDIVTNILTGNDGDDTLNGGTVAIADTLDGGNGTDTATYAGRTEDLSLTLNAVADDGATAENDTLTAIENLTGGDGNDIIGGDPLVNALSGSAGNDAITSRDSVGDTVLCGAGATDTVTADLNDAIETGGACETVDRGPVPALAIADATVIEGNAGTTSAVVTVSAIPTPTAPVTVQYGTGGGTATAPADYAATSGTLTFAAGEATKTITVPVVGDTGFEGDETFGVGLANSTNATLPANVATVTIKNDDAFVPEITLAPAKVTEGDTGTKKATFTVKLDQKTTVPVAVKYQTADNTATQPSDYKATAGTVTIAAGATSGTVSVNVVGDKVSEPEETFGLILTSATNGKLKATPTIGVGTIIDNDTKAKAKLTAKIAPTRDTAAPFVFTATGKLTLPKGLKASTACKTGTITVTYRVGTKTVKTSKGKLSKTCTFKVKTTFKTAKDVKAVNGKAKFTARVRFGGNSKLSSVSKTLKLRAG